jgi:aryl-alcohol dehydrogenase-like predicted oxidoreductase
MSYQNGPEMAPRLRRLGGTDIEVTSIGLGAWQFSGGKGLAGAHWPALSAKETNEIVRAALARRITWFDTAEIYGNGRSERVLSNALKAAGKRNGDVMVATKWWPALRTGGSIRNTIDERLHCLDGFSIDLYQIHNPASFSSVETEMEAMADLVEAGKVRAVGVSNFSARRMRRAHEALGRRGLPLASNQVKYSLLDRRIESNGVLAAAKELGVSIIAYSPLQQGLLTGKFHKNPEIIRNRPGPRKWMRAFRANGLDHSRPLIDGLEEIAANHHVTPAEVALNWLVNFHGDMVVAIPGATKPSHVEHNGGAMNIALSQGETERLDLLSRASL